MAGSKSATRMPMIAMTTRSSTSVKPRLFCVAWFVFIPFAFCQLPCTLPVRIAHATRRSFHARARKLLKQKLGGHVSHNRHYSPRRDASRGDFLSRRVDGMNTLAFLLEANFSAPLNWEDCRQHIGIPTSSATPFVSHRVVSLREL